MRREESTSRTDTAVAAPAERRPPRLPRLLLTVAVGAALVAPQAAHATVAAPAPAPAAKAPAVVSAGGDRVPVATRASALPRDWATSPDLAWTTSGDATGFHLLVAASRDGYAWRTVASLSEPGFETDRWVGNACLTASGRRAVVVYAPRQFTNTEALARRGAFAAVVDLAGGRVTKLPVTASLAYHDPGCGAGETAILTQSDLSRSRATRVHVLDTAAAKVVRRQEVAGQLTSAVPVAGGFVAAAPAGLVRFTADGRQQRLAATRGPAFAVRPDARGGVAFLEAHGTAAAARYAAGGTVRELARGRLTDLGLVAGAAGRVFLTGTPTSVAALPATVTRVAAPTGAELSTTGRLATSHEEARAPVTDGPTAAAARGAGTGGPDVAAPVSLRSTVPATGADLRFRVRPAVAAGASASQGRAESPALRISAGTATKAARAPKAGKVRAATDPEPGGGESTDPMRTCAVPRNDPRSQVYQPYWRQVEWAADQAVVGRLTTQRPANWKQSGLPAWAPQVLEPRRGLFSHPAKHVPAQIMLGVLAQESNLWQASSHALEGVYGNPLVGNFYGRDIYDDDTSDDWVIRWDKSDCGYGVAQVTDGMRQGDTSRGTQEKRAIALDYATNVAAGLRILEEKWNQVQDLGVTLNNNDPSRPENWFAALWAYNTGLQPRDADAGNPSGCAPGPSCTDSRGNFGLGWFNNPINPDYDPNRKLFLERSQDDARFPQKWPYPEKVIGWAAHPIVKSNPFTGAYQGGYNQAWWNDPWGDARFRTDAKPPRALFCNATNHCNPDAAQPCQESDYHCWWNRPADWKGNCRITVTGPSGTLTTYDTCGNESVRYDPGLAEPADWNAWYRPNCDGDTMPDAPVGAWVVDDVYDSQPSARPCADNVTNAGEFRLSFAPDETGHYRSKIDFHQLGGGYNGHFWFASMQHILGPRHDFKVTGTWAFNRDLHGWGRVIVHIPDHQSHASQARYQISLGDGRIKTRVVNVKSLRLPENGHRWVDLGVFQFAGQPAVSLSNEDYEGDGDGVTWDALAIQPLPAKPRNVVVVLGDSYTSGEGVGTYFGETDVDGDLEQRRNHCHRAPVSWPRRVHLSDDVDNDIGTREDTFDPNLSFAFLACSGAQTENLLPKGVQNAFGDPGRGTDGEVSQLDAGFLDENTTLVMLTIGGNDLGWSDAFRNCLYVAAGDDCHTTTMPGDPKPYGDMLVDKLQGPVHDSVLQVLRQINAAAPHAKIVLMGYPRLLSNGGDCLRVTITNPVTKKQYPLGIGPQETAFMASMADRLVGQMATAVTQLKDRAGEPVEAYFADPRQEFEGHGVCGAEPWIRSFVLQLTRGEERPVGGWWPALGLSQQSFHPTATGVQAYTSAMELELRRSGG